MPVQQTILPPPTKRSPDCRSTKAAMRPSSPIWQKTAAYSEQAMRANSRKGRSHQALQRSQIRQWRSAPECSELGAGWCRRLKGRDARLDGRALGVRNRTGRYRPAPPPHRALSHGVGKGRARRLEGPGGHGHERSPAGERIQREGAGGKNGTMSRPPLQLPPPSLPQIENSAQFPLTLRGEGGIVLHG